MEQPICFVRPAALSLCKPVNESADILIQGQDYQLVADEDAVAEDARFLYLKALFVPADGQPYGNFRKTALCRDLTTMAGYEDEQWLDPANVTSIGHIAWIEHHVECKMVMGKYEVIEIIREFR
jgi:hypothetical protein